MKKLICLTLALLFLLCGCRAKSPGMTAPAAKPVIYFYPETVTDVIGFVVVLGLTLLNRMAAKKTAELAA